jgi:dihydroflavonol-4-reductase
MNYARQGRTVRALEGRSSSRNSVEKLFFFYSKEHADEYLKKIEWVKGDVRDIFALEDALEGVEQVYHCAAVVSFDPRDRELMTEINDKGTANVVNACLDAE